MKKGICFMVTATLCAMLLTACGNNSRPSGDINAQNGSESSSTVQSSQADNQDNGVIAGTVLVVYYSASGNTKAVTEMIARYTDGDIFEIVPVEAYTNEDLDWGQEGSRVNREHEDESLQDVALVSTTVEDFDSYDTVFIGYPKMEYGFDCVLCV